MKKKYSSQLIELHSRLVGFLKNPPHWFEPLIWSLLITAIAVPRTLMFIIAPAALWSGDANSYFNPAMQLLSGEWEITSRRGFGYIAMIMPFLLLPENFFPALAIFQQAMFGAVILGSAIFLRLILGRASLLFILFVGVGASLFDVPIFVAHLIRNETPHAFFTMLGFGFLGLAFKKKSSGTAVLCGISFAAMNLVKGTIPLAAIIASSALWWQHRSTPRGWFPPAVLLLCYYLIYFLPNILSQLPGIELKTQSYAGRELYSQVAHIGLVDSKKFPEITKSIKDEVEKYISLNKRDNGYVREHIISEITKITEQNPDTYPSSDKICRSLAFQIITTYPVEYAGDLWKKILILHTRTGFQAERPRLKHIRDAGEEAREHVEGQLKKLQLLPELVVTSQTAETKIQTQNQIELFEKLAEARRNERFSINFAPALALETSTDTPTLQFLKKLTTFAFPFNAIPIVLLTTCLSLLLPFCTHGALRQWCIQLTLTWLFFVLLHTTVGEPKDRFLVPVFCITLFMLTVATYQLARATSHIVSQMAGGFTIQK